MKKHLKIKRAIPVIFIVQLMCFVFISCNDDSSSSAGGFSYSFVASDCKDVLFSEGFILDEAVEDCLFLEVTADGSATVLHSNATFNCCPGEIVTDVRVDGNTIYISENEREAGCLCLCLYDIVYRFEGLPAGLYSVIVDEPYRAPFDPVLQCDFSFQPESSSHCCVKRATYPWIM